MDPSATAVGGLVPFGPFLNFGTLVHFSRMWLGRELWPPLSGWEQYGQVVMVNAWDTVQDTCCMLLSQISQSCNQTLFSVFTWTTDEDLSRPWHSSHTKILEWLYENSLIIKCQDFGRPRITLFQQLQYQSIEIIELEEVLVMPPLGSIWKSKSNLGRVRKGRRHKIKLCTWTAAYAMHCGVTISPLPSKTARTAYWQWEKDRRSRRLPKWEHSPWVKQLENHTLAVVDFCCRGRLVSLSNMHKHPSFDGSILSAVEP